MGGCNLVGWGCGCNLVGQGWGCNLVVVANGEGGCNQIGGLHQDSCLTESVSQVCGGGQGEEGGDGRGWGKQVQFTTTAAPPTSLSTTMMCATAMMCAAAMRCATAMTCSTAMMCAAAIQAAVYQVLG